MSTLIRKIRRTLSAALLVTSVACFGYGGCASDVAYFVEDLADYAGVVVFDEFFVDDIFYEDLYYYDDGFDLGLEIY